jgi:nucleoside-diphosphate-sugar epimerase
MNFNVFHAAAALGLRRVVWASSETTLGLPFGGGPEQFPGAPGLPARYAPVDEDHFPVPTTTYALSKVASETVAEQLTRWSGIPFVGLRISNIMDPEEYQRFPSFWPDPQLREWNLWSYVDVFPGVPLTRDVGEFGTLLAIDRARELPGYQPGHSWRDHL